VKEMRGAKKPVNEGFLSIKDAKKDKWYKRYFVLRRNLLTVYNSKYAAQPVPVAVIPLHGCFIDPEFKNEGNPLAFAIEHEKRKTIFLAADNELDMNEWKKFITEAATINISEEGKKTPFKAVEGKKAADKAPCSLVESFGDCQMSSKLALDVGDLTGIFRGGFFILKENVVFHCNSQKDDSAVNAIELEDYAVNILNKDKYLFEVTHPNSTTWKLKAENTDIFDKWVDALKKAIAVIQDFSDNLKADAMIEEQKKKGGNKKKNRTGKETEEKQEDTKQATNEEKKQ